MVLPLVETKTGIDHPYWLAGFTSDEGCFMVNIKADKTYSIGFKVILIFQLTQHVKDELLMRTLMKYIDCGNLYKNREIFDLKESFIIS